MPTRIDFQKDPPVNFFGAFYPLGYGVLAFKEKQEAERLKKLLLENGFHEADMTMIAATDLVKAEGGEVDHVDGVARAVGGETKTMEKHRELAKAGATFLMVFAPDDASTERLSSALKGFTPLTSDKYERLTINGL